MKKLSLITLLSTLAINNAWATDNTVGAGAGAGSRIPVPSTMLEAQNGLLVKLNYALTGDDTQEVRGEALQKFLAEHAANKDMMETAMMLAAASPKATPKMLKMIIDAGGNPNVHLASRNNMPVIMYAVDSQASPEKIKVLIDAGADPRLTPSGKCSNALDDNAISKIYDNMYHPDVLGLLMLGASAARSGRKKAKTETKVETKKTT